MSTQTKTQREIDDEILAAGRKRFEHDLRETFGKDVNIAIVSRAVAEHFAEIAQSRWRELQHYVGSSRDDESIDDRRKTLAYVASTVDAIRRDLDRCERARNAE